MAEAVIFVGLQGSGKTTYFTKHLAATHTHVSRDIQQTAERERALIRECLRSGRSFVVDDTNATRAVREPYIREAKAAGFNVLSYFFDTPVRTAIGRNNHRKDKKPIPVPAMLRTAKRLEPPSLEEGIDEIRTITTARDPAVTKCCS
jgi:predicted kinase